VNGGEIVRWTWLAPFGRVGRALGFRWVYPFGTLPLPFHPLFVPGVLVAATCWAGWKVVSLVEGDASDAWGPALLLMAAAGVVGIGLSVPVLSWFVLVLGGRIIQAVLVLAAMVLLAVGAATGRNAPWAAVPPAAFVLAWAVAVVRGRVARARLEADARDFDPVAGQGRSVVLTGQLDPRTITALLEQAGARAVWTQTHASRTATMHVRITHETAAAVRERARGTLPDGAVLRDREDHLVLELASTPPREAVWVEVQVDRSAEHVGGPLHLVTVGDTSGARTVVTGMASVVLPVPLAQCFHWVSLTGPNEWCVGFARGRARRIGPGIESLHELFRPGVPVAPLGSPTSDGLLAPLGEQLAARDTAVVELREAALTVPFDSRAHRATLDVLWKDPHLLGDDAPAYLADWMRRARAGAQPGLPATIARLVMRLSDDDIVSHGADFLDAFNSRKLALQWTLTPDLDRAPLPKDLYRFGDKAGFGLLLTHPELYVRLGDLLPSYRRLVSAVAQEMTVPDLVDEALTQWAAEG
jgi:hypothetical protein